MSQRRHATIVWILGLLLLIQAIDGRAFISSSRPFRFPPTTRLTHEIEALGHDQPLLTLRGGELEPSKDGGFASKLRNIIRNVLKLTDKKSPPISGVLRRCLRSMERFTGLQMLPNEGSKKKRKNVKEEKATKSKETAPASQPKRQPSTKTKKHLSKNLKNSNPNYRIQRELKEFIKSPPPNLSVQVGTNMRVWIVTMVGANTTIYEGEVFKLRVSFPTGYPTVPPSVYFVPGHIPVHEHVYTNGDICLSLLGKDWRPTMTAQSIAVSILSILSSAQSKSLPMDNAMHAGQKPGEYQKDWVYHDDNC